MLQKVKIELFVLFLAALITGCSSSVRFASKDVSSYIEDKTENYFSVENSMIITEAVNWLGTPYCYGGESRSCTDCSGYVQQVYLSAGIYLPRTAAEQYSYSIQINEEESQPGDLIFFKNRKKINHVGIYIGGNEFIHASSSNGVEKQSLNNRYYKSRFVGYGRFVH